MRKYLQKKLNNEKGMTLIELLAVIVIIAIIAAIAIPAIGNIIENSRYGAVKSDFQNAIASANLYIADEGKDPVDLNNLDPYIEDAGSLVTLTFSRSTAEETKGELLVTGTFKIGDKSFKMKSAKTNSELSALSSEEFKGITEAVSGG